MRMGVYLCGMIKAGILGGGQLGRMLLQAAANYPIETHVLESDPDCPAAHLCHHFTRGNIRDFNDVLAFGRKLDVVTIEIESVNIDALEQLESEGICIIPKPSTLRLIADKVTQKIFYRDNQIPTSEFEITESRDALQQFPDFFPGVHKLGTGGYDGKGVQLLETMADMPLGFNERSVLEKKVNIKKEISILIAVDRNMKMAIYPPVDMVFDPTLNLISYQFCPAKLSEKVFQKSEAIAIKVVKDLKSPGFFAVELFIDADDRVLVNETAPRVHNSGHHTIEACYSSQFDMLWRILLGYPLGNPKLIMQAAIVNLVGESGFSGVAYYEGLEKILEMDNVFVHIYGKAATRPGRKMGHVTILDTNDSALLHRANQIRNTLYVKSASNF